MDNSTCSQKEQIRLIDANEALRMICDSRTDNPFASSPTHRIWEQAHNCAIDCVEACDAIDPESLRPQGEWIDLYGGKYANHRYVCSACHADALYKFEVDALGKEKAVQALSKCCPECGAKMKGGGAIAVT